jgi:hypothetical protein
MRAAFEAATTLALGARGLLDGTPFELVGRICVRGRRDAQWNEWTLRCDDGRLLYLTESMAGLTLYEESTILPGLEAFMPGKPVETGFVVVERGTATRLALWGESAGDPAATSYPYVELAAPSGALATIDFGVTPPRVFVGRRTTTEALGLHPSRASWFIAVPEVSRPSGVESWLDIGDEGELEGKRWRVIGVVSRSIEDAASRASWEEYVLFAPDDRALRWLVVADGHWSFVELVSPAGVVEEDEAASFDGVRHAALSGGTARVDWAAGELPWTVTIGETSEVKDFVAASWTLSCERSEDDLAWSRGTYVPADAIAKAFGKRHLPRPIGRAPHQP